MTKMLCRIATFLICVQPLYAQDAMRYREFELGSRLAAVTALTGVTPSQVKIIHQRPALIQELEWRPRFVWKAGSAESDPVTVVTFSFYDSQLFKIVVDYDGQRTAGMTDSDVIEAISSTYGPASIPPSGSKMAEPARYGVPDRPVAIWGSAEYVATLFRVAYPETFKLVLVHTRLDQLARSASIEATRLDTNEAPEREIARRQKEEDDAEAAREKARIENKAVFRP
jgi:hypothetical protein